jgi:hypothetical protein
MHPLFYFFPFIGAFTGWMLHSLLIHKLGPASRDFLAHNAGQWAEQNLFSVLRLDQKFNDPAHFEKLRPVIEEHIDQFLRVKLSQQMPVISMFVGDKTVEKMKSVFMEELALLFPQVIGRFAANLQQDINLRSLITEKIQSIPEKNWNQALRQHLGKPIAGFRKTGALTGFILGSLFLLLAILVAS